MIIILKCSCMANTNFNGKVILFIKGITIKIVRISYLSNSPLKIVFMHIKRFMRCKFLWAKVSIKVSIVFSFILIKDTGISVYI